MSVHEHAHEDKSAGYEQDSCAHAFAREIYEIKWVGKSANGHSWVELIHKLCKRLQKIEYSEFLHRVRLLFQCAMCGHVPLQRGYLGPTSSIFVRRFFQQGAAWSSRRESWVSFGSAKSRGMTGLSCHLEGCCLMTFFWIRDSPLCYLVTSLVLLIKNCPLNCNVGFTVDGFRGNIWKHVGRHATAVGGCKL